MIMHGSENALGALIPLDDDLVIVGGIPDWGMLVSLTVSHVLITWVVALIVIAFVATELRADRLAATRTLDEPEAGKAPAYARSRNRCCRQASRSGTWLNA